MNLRDTPIGQSLKVMRTYLVAEEGYWSWEQEEIEGTVYSHPNDSITYLQVGRSLVTCHNHKDEIIN